MTPAVGDIAAALADGAERATGDLTIAAFTLVGAAAACVERLRPAMAPDTAEDVALMLSSAAALLMEHGARARVLRNPVGCA